MERDQEFFSRVYLAFHFNSKNVMYILERYRVVKNKRIVIQALR